MKASISSAAGSEFSDGWERRRIGWGRRL